MRTQYSMKPSVICEETNYFKQVGLSIIYVLSYTILLLIAETEVNDVRSYLANIVSFFLIQKEIEQNIPQIQDINQLWVDAGKQLEKEINVKHLSF